MVDVARTSGDVDEVLAAGPVDFDVALTEVVLVAAESKRSLFSIVESHQRLTVTSPLRAQTQRHPTSTHVAHQSLSLCFNGHFPGMDLVSRYQNVSILHFIGSKDDGDGVNTLLEL